MNNTLTGFLYQIVYLFQHLTVSDFVDILAVAVIFFVVFQALHRTRALQLLRGAIIAAILGVAFLVLLPLSTLGWLVRGVLVAGLISLPILFQDELRKVLTGLGQIGRKRYYGTEFEAYKSAIIGAVKNLSARQHGALIVLEGQTPLEDIVETGIPIDTGPVSTELLQTIFFPNTPLHDGAVVMRGNRIVAASCILPVDKEKTGPTHLGTRHRAALGLSAQVPDAMVIIVSEETSRISVAQAGQIYMGLSPEQLDSRLDRFREQLSGNNRSRWSWLREVGLRGTLTNVGVVIILSVIAWLSVTYQTNPPQQVIIENVPLVVDRPAAGLLLMTDLPAVVDVQVQTTQDRIDELSVANIQANVNIVGLEPGEHRVPVQVQLPNSRSQLMWVKPTNVNLILEPEVTEVFTPTVKILDISNLPIGYSLSEISLSPETVMVKGPKSQVERIREVRVEVELDNRKSDFQVTSIPKLLTNEGSELDLNISPAAVLVTVPIQQNFFTKEVPIRADIIASSLATGYEIRSISISPSVVTLSGDRASIDRTGDYLSTTSIILDKVFDSLTIQAPLVVPEGVRILGETGDPVLSVQVKIDITPVESYLVIEKQIEPRNLPEGMSIQLSQESVTVLLIGPKPLLDQIKTNQDLIIIYLDLAGYNAGSYSIPIAIQAPAEIQVMVFPEEIQMVLDT